MHDKGIGPHKTQFRRDENYGNFLKYIYVVSKLKPYVNFATRVKRLSFGFFAVLLCWVTQDFELYAAFDPLADKVTFFSQGFGL